VHDQGGSEKGARPRRPRGERQNGNGNLWSLKKKGKKELGKPCGRAIGGSVNGRNKIITEWRVVQILVVKRQKGEDEAKSP